MNMYIMLIVTVVVIMLSLIAFIIGAYFIHAYKSFHDSRRNRTLAFTAILFFFSLSVLGLTVYSIL